jgi:hypothetical protein
MPEAAGTAKKPSATDPMAGRALDPIAVVWDALDAGGYDPHGQPHDFRARCPGHDGDNREALHVSEGSDRRALVWCFAGCSADAVVAALGLELRDLFPPGHRKARPVRLRAGRSPRLHGPARQAADTLAALDAAGRLWQLLILTSCAYCDGDRTVLTAASGKRLEVDCEFERCTAHEFAGALAAEVLRKGA